MIQKFVRKLTRASSRSFTINVPKEIIRELKWREKQKLEMVFDDKKKQFIVRDWRK
tara:strand:+ start:488 stop:655 length:168 start_codon:yes stop_codon:yes gene_type:complete